MALSEEEEQQLRLIEKTLYSDPDFFKTVHPNFYNRSDRMKGTVGVILFLFGLGLLIFGVATNLTFLGVIGFLAMLLGVYNIRVLLPKNANNFTDTIE